MNRLTPLAGSLLLLTILLGSADAQGIFIQRGNMSADALALEHSIKKLAAHDTGMQTLNAALKDLANYSQKYTRLAQRQGSYYKLQQAFDPMIARYVTARNLVENASDWAYGNPRMQEWRNIEDRFDQVYYDLYGYDLLDPYFGRHPDFAALPVRPQIPYSVLHPERPVYEQPTPLPYVLTPPSQPEPPVPSYRVKEAPRQF